MKGQVGLDDELVGNLGPVELLGNVEQMLLVANRQHDGVRSLGEVAGRAFASSVNNLSGLQPGGEVRANDYVVVGR